MTHWTMAPILCVILHQIDEIWKFPIKTRSFNISSFQFNKNIDTYIENCVK